MRRNFLRYLNFKLDATFFVCYFPLVALCRYLEGLTPY
jgi:hypothetical protein